MGLVLGLIGGVGSGKSRVAALLAEHGACLLPGDEAGHEALRQPEIRESVIRSFGTGILDEHGEIVRRRLGAIVFADEKQLRVLETITHPWIKGRLAAQAAAARERGCPLIVLDAAVLLEAGWDDLCDVIVYVHAPRAQRIERVRQQRGWGEEELRARERRQRSLTEKVTRADVAVDNSGSPVYLAQQVNGLLRQWQTRT